MNKNGYSRFLATMAGIIAVFCSTVNGEQKQRDIHLMPIPKQLTMKSGKLPIDGGFRIGLREHASPGLKKATARFFERMQRRTGIPMASISDADSENAVLEIICSGADDAVQSMPADESYSLEISDTRALLAAQSTIGILRGLETFLQLIDIDADSYYVPSLSIEDRPRFKWRGLLIDVSRHWESVEIIRKNLEAMAAVKMNVLHWHLSDDQGFRVESKIFPKLHESGSDGNYYRQSEIREIVSYARDLGIRIIPEFDMPGHSTSWLVAYPELAAAPGPYSIESKWGVFDPCMDPTREELYSFLDAFIAEMKTLFPDEYFHIGGDEVNGKQWNASPGIREFKARHKMTNNHDLQAYFNQRMLDILKKHGKKMIGWDEILHPDLPQNIVVQSWRGQASLAKGARMGYGGILSYGYYLDHMRPASFHYAMDPLGNEAADLTEEEKSRILGGEACMWAEFVNHENILSRIWPRAAAIAERLWSPPEVLRDIPDMYRRLEYIESELRYLGLNYRSHMLDNLQRMAGDPDDVFPLLNFTGLLQPPGLGTRQRTQTYSSHTPLNRLVDIIKPESTIARLFGTRVETMLQRRAEDPAVPQEIRHTLASWIDNYTELETVIKGSYLLKEIQPLAETIRALCIRSMEALDYLESNRSPSQQWRQETADLLKRAEKPHAEILIAILSPAKQLIEAALEQNAETE